MLPNIANQNCLPIRAGLSAVIWPHADLSEGRTAQGDRNHNQNAIKHRLVSAAKSAAVPKPDLRLIIMDQRDLADLVESQLTRSSRVAFVNFSLPFRGYSERRSNLFAQLHFLLRMIFSERRLPLFRVVRKPVRLRTSYRMRG